MAKRVYNRLNYLKRCKIIVEIVNLHYREGLTTYAGVFRTFVEPFYPMSYKSFMKIVNMKNIAIQIKEEQDRLGKSDENNSQEVLPNQLRIF